MISTRVLSTGMEGEQTALFVRIFHLSSSQLALVRRFAYFQTGVGKCPILGILDITS